MLSPQLLQVRRQHTKDFFSYYSWFVFSLFFVSLFVRLFYLFSFQLIPGVNGGYYPLQVKSILQHGSLAFADAPLIFYVNAAIVWILHIAGFELSNHPIIFVLKITDALSIPLTIFPLTWIFRTISANRNIPTVLMIFILFSFAPLTLIADLQKQSLATLWFCLLLVSYIQFHQTGKLRYLWYAVALYIVIALTHSGIFALTTLFYGILLFLSIKQQKNLLKILGFSVIIASGMVLVYLYDTTRFIRLIEFWKHIFNQPMFTGYVGPFEFMSTALSILLIIHTIISHKPTQNLQVNLAITSAVILLVCSFPLLDAEYFKRFALFTYIPQSLLIIALSPFTKDSISKIIKVIIGLYVVASILLVLSRPRMPVLNTEAQHELAICCELVETNRSSTIIVAPHGIEWWTAWFCNVNITQPQYLNKGLDEQYQNIYFIEPKGTMIKHLPPPAENPQLSSYQRQLIYSGKYLSFYHLQVINQ